MSKIRSNIIKDISSLYELSLSIGQSLDFNKNCESFLNMLMARKNLEICSVYIIDPAKPSRKLKLAYANPESRIVNKTISLSDPIFKLLGKNKCVSISESDSKDFNNYIHEKDVKGGTYMIFQLKSMGILKVYSSVKKERASKRELNQLNNVIEKFAVALEGCLFHEISIKEANERIRIQNSLREKDKLYKTIISNLRGGILIINSNSRIIYANEIICNLIEYEEEELLGASPFSILINQRNNLGQLLTDNNQKYLENVNQEFEIEQSGGLPKWVEINSSTYYDEDNEVNGIICVCNDITERRFAELKIKSLSRFPEEDPSPVLRFSLKKMSFIYYNKGGEKIINFLDKEENKQVKQNFLQSIFHSFESNTYLERVEITVDDKYYLCNIVPIPSDSYTNIYATDITAIKDAHAAISRSEEKYRGIIEGLHLGLLEVDIDNKVIEAYPGFCKMTGYSPEELKRKNIIDFLLTPRFRKLAERQYKNRNTGKAGVYEVQVKKKNGDIVWFLISGAPLYDENNQIKGSVGVSLDISKRRQMEEELINARHRAEESSKAKERFLANMSHEIRTPMNAIVGISNLMADTDLTNKQNQYLNAIKVSADNLLVIINDILDFSKIETGKLTIDKIGFRLSELLQALVTSNKYKAEENGVLLQFYMDPKIHDILLSDPVRINQILLNLLSNSIKFSPNGEVKLNCNFEDEDEDTVTTMFEVSDTGIGIEKDKVEHIFESFTQEDQSTSRKFGGTGLGLAITKQLVGLLGGKIDLYSVKGEGTKFYVTLKFEKGKSSDLIIEDKHVYESESLEGKKVLLAEDHEMNRLVAETVLKKWGLEVGIAVNGKIAVEMVKENNYDIVLMDMQMPELSGIEATKVIRNEFKNSIPIIALTANALKGDDKKCIEAGMNDYLSKPFEPEDLFNKIAKYIGSKSSSKHNSVQHQKVKKSSSGQNIKLYNLSKIEKISKGDDNFMKNMVNLFIHQVPDLMQKIEHHYKNEDWKSLSADAHKLKSTIDSMGIISLKEDIRKVEKVSDEKSDLENLKILIPKIRKVLDEAISQMQLENFD